MTAARHRALRHGIVILPDRRWAEASGAWRRADELGFDHAWTFDHTSWRSLSDGPWFPAMPTLVAAAGVTTRLRLGTLVANPNLRHPVTFAKDVIALDDVSGGRAVCGIGAGAPGADAEVLGHPPLGPAARAARFEEFVELLDLLLTGAQTSYAGAHYRAHDARAHPGCVQRPRVPFVLAAAGGRGMRLAARRAEGWATVGIPGNFEPARFDENAPLLERQLARLDEACAAEGRDPSSLRRMVVAGAQLGGVLESAGSFEEAEGIFGELGFTDMIVFWPRPDAPFRGRLEVLDEIAPLLEREPPPLDAAP